MTLCVSSVLLKGLQELMASSQTSSGPGSPSSSSLQIRLTRLEESGGSPAPSSVAALQIPVQIPLQITHLGETCCNVCVCDGFCPFVCVCDHFLTVDSVCLSSSVRLFSSSQRQWDHHSEHRSPADLRDPAGENNSVSFRFTSSSRDVEPEVMLTEYLKHWLKFVWLVELSFQATAGETSSVS